MKEPENTTRALRLERERLLLRYSDALERGDLDVVSAVLAQAETDAELERSLWELHLALGEEARQEQEQLVKAGLDRDAATVAALAASHFDTSVVSASSALPLREEEELAPLTVADIAADLRSRTELDAASRSLVQQLQDNAEPLQSNLSARGVRALLARLGLPQASRRLVELFQDAAFALGLQRQEQTFRLAAARRQNTGPAQTSAPPVGVQTVLQETGTQYLAAPESRQSSNGRPSDADPSDERPSDKKKLNVDSSGELPSGFTPDEAQSAETKEEMRDMP